MGVMTIREVCDEHSSRGWAARLAHHAFAAEYDDIAVAQPAPQSVRQREAEAQSQADWQREHGIAVKYCLSGTSTPG